MNFAHKDDNYNPKQLFICSDWEPSPANILIEFQACVSHFLKHLLDLAMANAGVVVVDRCLAPPAVTWISGLPPFGGGIPGVPSTTIYNTPDTSDKLDWLYWRNLTTTTINQQ
jgi:hypothetical protein